jgi:hypothetical protein
LEIYGDDRMDSSLATKELSLSPLSRSLATLSLSHGENRVLGLKVLLFTSKKWSVKPKEQVDGEGK